MSEKLFLKPNAVPEPLFDGWYAWAHLVSPPTAAMNIVNRHLKIMDSYIQAPKIHAAAVKNPKMLGGPFMDYDGDRTAAVEELRANTLDKQRHMIEFAEAAVALNEMLLEEGRGFSLESLYSKVPDMLRGFVELVYDLNNRPTFRFFEPLLYRSKYYDETSQSVSLSLLTEDERPFVLSTPRLEDSSSLHLKVPFRHSGLDDLFRMRREPQPLHFIADRLGLHDEAAHRLGDFLTPDSPTPYREYTGDQIRMRYFGHACILLETRGISILSDPVVSYYGYESDVSRYTYYDLPDEIDYVLITHNHQDHILIESMLQLRHKVKTIVVPAGGRGDLQDPSLKLMFKALGFANVIELGEMESIAFEDIQITGLPFLGEHADLDIRTKLCHHVRLGDLTVLFAADSCNVEPRVYEHVQKEIGDIDVIFLGMECDGAPLSWMYGPLLPQALARGKDQSRRLAGSNCERGIDLVFRFNPREVYVYAMGQEPWLNYVMSKKYTDSSGPIVASNRLIEECHHRRITAERLFGEKEIYYASARPHSSTTLERPQATAD